MGATTIVFVYDERAHLTNAVSCLVLRSLERLLRSSSTPRQFAEPFKSTDPPSPSQSRAGIAKPNPKACRYPIDLDIGIELAIQIQLGSRVSHQSDGGLFQSRESLAKLPCQSYHVDPKTYKAGILPPPHDNLPCYTTSPRRERWRWGCDAHRTAPFKHKATPHSPWCYATSQRSYLPLLIFSFIVE